MHDNSQDITRVQKIINCSGSLCNQRRKTMSEDKYPNETMRGIKLANNFMSCLVLSELKTCGPQKVASSVLQGPVTWAATMEQPFSGPPSSGSLYHLPVVSLVFKLKPGLSKPPQQIYLPVGCPQAMAHPGMTKVALNTTILPGYNHGKYGGAFLSVKQDKQGNVK